MSRQWVPLAQTSAHPANAIPRPPRLGEAVYEAILQKLISMEIAPDDRITVDDLVRKLGVSQTPIREALTRLETHGLVIKTHLIGYRAAPQPTKGQFEELYDARFLIEPYAAAKAAVSITDSTLADLERLLESVDGFTQNPGNDSFVQFAQVDTEFHRTIAAQSGNTIVSGMIDGLQTRIQFFLLRRSATQPDASPPNEEHKRILAALRGHDPELAAETMREHLQRSRARYWP
jgi:DNA-binding GntR family transcriptional regulator